MTQSLSIRNPTALIFMRTKWAIEINVHEKKKTSQLFNLQLFLSFESEPHEPWKRAIDLIDGFLGCRYESKDIREERDQRECLMTIYKFHFVARSPQPSTRIDACQDFKRKRWLFGKPSNFMHSLLLSVGLNILTVIRPGKKTSIEFSYPRRLSTLVSGSSNEHSWCNHSSW